MVSVFWSGVLAVCSGRTRSVVLDADSGRISSSGSDKCGGIHCLTARGDLGSAELPFLPFNESVVHRFPQ